MLKWQNLANSLISGRKGCKASGCRLFLTSLLTIRHQDQTPCLLYRGDHVLLVFNLVSYACVDVLRRLG